MPFVATSAEMRSAEAECAVRSLSYSEMMYNAGCAAAGRIIEEYPPCPAVVLCGAGNNGGDGFVIAQKLYEKGYKIRVILADGVPKTDIAREYFETLPKKIVYDYTKDEQICDGILKNADMAIDCVFGTGFHGSLPSRVSKLLSSANSVPARIAVDIPSGMNSDTGECDPFCFKPTRTLVIAALKKGMLVPQALETLGEFELLDIGITDDCFKEYEAILLGDEMREILPKRGITAHKGSFGRLLNIAGSLCCSGAAVMSTRAALRSGTGLCTLAAPVSTVKALTGTLVENTFLPLPETESGSIGGDCKAIAEVLPKMTAVSVGCGLGNSENTRKITEFVIKHANCPIIIDADGINSIAENINVLKERTGDTVITPHPLEFSRISGLSVAEIQADRISAARRFALEYGVTVLLKGAYTVISDPKGNAAVNTTGNGALSKGGSGDVLTGIIGAMSAQGIPAYDAAKAGAYCHGYAADLLVKTSSPACVVASDIIEVLPRVYK